MSRCDVREGLHDEFDLSPYEAPYPEDAGDRMLAGMQKTLTNDGLDMLCYGGGIGERICGRASDAPFEREEITDVYEKVGENIVRTFEATQGTKALGELVVKNQDEVRALLRRLHADESGAVNIDQARRLLLDLLERRAGKSPKLGAMAGKRLGHTFSKHGVANTEQLLREAKGSGRPVGQWLDEAEAESFIADRLDQLSNGSKTFDLPTGMGRVVNPDGTFTPATKARLVPSKSGVKTAFPME